MVYSCTTHDLTEEAQIQLQSGKCPWCFGTLVVVEGHDECLSCRIAFHGTLTPQSMGYTRRPDPLP